MLSNPEHLSPVQVYSEFQPLEEVVIGTPYPADAFDLIEDPELRAMLRLIMEQSAEDCQRLDDMLTKMGIRVRRPQVIFKLMEEKDGKPGFKNLDLGIWKCANPNPPLWPRDLTLTYGDRLLSTYSRAMSRWCEGQSFYSLFYEYMEKGADWRSMPPPILSGKRKSYDAYEGDTVLFHAANILRCGKDIFHTRPASQAEGGKGTVAGLNWLKRQLPEARFNAVNKHGHLDGKVALIKPGLLMSWLKREELPEKLQAWDMIELRSQGQMPAEFMRLRGERYYKEFIKGWLEEWIGYVDETYFDVNVLSLSESQVLLNGTNPWLIKELAKYGVEGIPFDFRHRYFWDGGLHCISLDVRRKGPCEDYFS
jgi:glycine amidinotransferase/scyllo-inosamine-4-phosphate amidinotransferase 1